VAGCVPPVILGAVWGTAVPPRAAVADAEGCGSKGPNGPITRFAAVLARIGVARGVNVPSGC
jgi:hypothetical protein